MSLVVVYDKGAVSPTDILTKVSIPLIVVLADSAHAQRMRPLFGESCEAVHDLSDPGLAATLGATALSGILTFSEPMLPATARLAARLELPFHDESVVAALTRKDVQRQTLGDAGVDDTVSVCLTRAGEWDDAIAKTGLPAVVKPARGVNSRNTVLVHDADLGRELFTTILADEGVVVVERYLAGITVEEPWGDYVSIETVVQRGDVRHLAVTGKLRLAPPFRECGQFWPANLSAHTHREALDLADRAIKALRVDTGILHTEMKLTKAGPRIIEVNGRIGGYIPELARQAAGIDLVDVGARIACGDRVELPPVEPDGVYFQFTTPAPVEAGTVVSVCRKADLGDLPGLVGYTPLVRRGDAVGGFGTQDLNLVSVTAPDHDALVPVIDTIMDRIVFEFDLDGHRVARTARDLVHRNLESNNR